MRYILITGINFNNKGAEAMMFHLYHYLQKRWPDKKVVALCKNSEEQLKKYRERYKLRTLSFYPADFLTHREGCTAWQGVSGEYRAAKTAQDSAGLCTMRICVLTQADLFFQANLDFWIIMYG